MPKRTPFRYFKTSSEIIRLVVMLYVRFPLSLRIVEDLLHERGVDVSHEAIRFWRWDASNRLVYLDFGDDHLWRISVGMKGVWQKHARKFKKQAFINRIMAQNKSSLDQDLSFF